MQTKTELKLKLLETCLFLDNEYLDQYLDLVLERKQKNGYTEKHHILQRNYFKKNKIQIDNSEDNLVSLTYCDHCKAHWLLYFCTIDYLKQANMHAVKYISEMYKKLTGIEKHKFDFNQEDFELLQKYMNDIIDNDESRYWSHDEIDYLKENYKGYGAGPKCAKALNRPLKQINEKARLLGLSVACPNWTAEELDILYTYYPIEGDQVYLRILNHTQQACRQKAKDLKIRTKNHYWSEEEIDILVANFSKLGPMGCSKLLKNRNKNECKHKAARLGLVYINNPQQIWNSTQLNKLLVNKNLPITELQKILGCSYGAVKNQLCKLNLYDSKIHCKRNCKGEAKNGKNIERREAKN